MSDQEDKPQDDLSQDWKALAKEEDSSDEEGDDAVLSQDEINGLLTQSPSSEEGDGWQVLVDSNQISYERLPMLEVVFDRLVRLLSTSLRNFTSDNVEVTLKSMSSIRFGDYLKDVSLPTLIGVFQAKEWKTNALLTIDTSLIYAIVDVLLGGRHGRSPSGLDDRPFTTIETRLIERMVRVVLEDFTKAFEPVSPVTFGFDRMETTPIFATIVRPVSASILIKIGLEIDGREGTFEFVIPYSSLEPVRHLLGQMFMGEKTGGDNIWESHFGQEVWQAEINLEGILEKTTLPLGTVLNWEKGSQITLRAKPDSPISLFSNGKLVLTGKMGRRNGNVSVQIDKNFIQKRKAS